MPQLVQRNLWQIIARTEALKPSGDGLRVDRFAIVLDEDIARIVPEYMLIGTEPPYFHFFPSAEYARATREEQSKTPSCVRLA